MAVSIILFAILITGTPSLSISHSYNFIELINASSLIFINAYVVPLQYQIIIVSWIQGPPIEPLPPPARLPTPAEYMESARKRCSLGGMQATTIIKPSPNYRPKPAWVSRPPTSVSVMIINYYSLNFLWDTWIFYKIMYVLFMFWLIIFLAKFHGYVVVRIR